MFEPVGRLTYVLSKGLIPRLMANGYQPRNSMNFIGSLGPPMYVVAGWRQTGYVNATATARYPHSAQIPSGKCRRTALRRTLPRPTVCLFLRRADLLAFWYTKTSGPCGWLIDPARCGLHSGNDSGTTCFPPRTAGSEPFCYAVSYYRVHRWATLWPFVLQRPLIES